MRVWVTRAQPGAERTAARLRTMGRDPLVAPLLAVRALPESAIDLRGVEALAFTSANSVAAFAARSSEGRALPVFTVGGATARGARAAGFARVSSAEGDVRALAALILAAGPGGQVLHAGAREPAGDLVGALNARGVPARLAALYETAALPLAPEVADAWPRLETLLIHSPRAAEAFVAATRERATGGLTAACISDAAAAPLRGRVGEVRVAARPDESALLDLLGKPARSG